MENKEEYWKKRCELAEKVLIGRTTTFKTEDTLTYQAYQRWSEMINESNPLFNGEVSAPCSEEEKERALKFMDEIFSGLDTNKKDISDAKKAMIKNIDQMYSDKEDKPC